VTVVSRNSIWSVALALICLFGPAVSQAQLFGDDEARRAILDLRQRFDQAVLAQNRLVEENTTLRRSMLKLQSDIDSLRDDLARQRGREDELEHELAQVKAQQAQLTTAAQNQSQPPGTPPDENAPAASPDNQGSAAGAAPAAASASEKQEFNAALGKFQSGDFRGAQGDFAGFVKRHPGSALAPEALFWLGNAQYATRDYKQAITNFRSLLTASPNSPRAPEALLSIASCQTELGDNKAARTTLESLVKQYPQSHAAQAARDRLAKSK
jgi:tol-pal system protein YbgF